MSVVLSEAWIAQLLTAAGVIALLAAVAVVAPVAWQLVRERQAVAATQGRASTDRAPLLLIAWANASTQRRLVPLPVVASARATRAPPGGRMDSFVEPFPASRPSTPRPSAPAPRRIDGNQPESD